MSENPASIPCPNCATPLPADAPGGLCPQCLLAAVSLPTDQDTLLLTRADFPGIAEVAAAFPDLEILGLIGQGGMGVVFKARQPRLDRLVALKILPKLLAATPGFTQRFNREGRVLARLAHPNIVSVHDFGESGGFCYLLIEYVDGVNLRQAMRAGRFTPEQALEVVPHICAALQYAHEQGVLHRDIKPENILLDSKGRVKIADFGIAKIISEDAADAMLLTQSGAKLGTAPYMAPEQIEKPASVDHRADIYSLGVVFYEMLTGELPLGRFAAPSEKSAVGGSVDEVVFRALDKERDRRQQSAGEFKTQIEGLNVKRTFSSFSPRPASDGNFEYKSKRKLFGLPLLHVARGTDPTTGEKRVARGFFAFGDIAVGVIAFGGYARGWFACGGMAVGGIAIGGLSLGLVSWGGLALALLLAVGGLAIGPLATGGAALGWNAMGGLALGWNAVGGVAVAQHGMGGRVIAPHVVSKLVEMPETLRLMADVSWWTSMGSFLWLPLMLPMMIVPWWARRQLEIEAGTVTGAGRQSPNRVLWIIPALTLMGAVLWWMFYRWTQAAGVGMANLIFATVIGCTGILLFVLSVPLWLRLVPMNRLYGVRLPSTFASDARWYDVNAHFGRQLFWWSLTVISAGIAGFYQLPRHQDSYPWAAVTLLLVVVATVVISTLWWMRQHPVNAPARKRNRLVSWGGQCLVAVVIAMFIKSFIAEAYRVPQGSEPGVAKDSHWIASHLDTGFSTGDLIIFEHESGQNWIARVVAREDKGLLLKRGGRPDEFFIPWDKIVGKMLFSHFSPDAQKTTTISATVPAQPVTEGTAKALAQKPVLRFTRLKRNGEEWQWPVYSPQGTPADEMESKRLIQASVVGGVETLNAEDCWLQLWFEHPDFDRHSHLSVEITDVKGQPLPERDSSTSAPSWASTRPHPAMLSCVISPGRRDRLPAAARIVLRYSIGPWEKRATLPSDYNGSMTFGKGCLLAAFGDDHMRRAFVSWSKNPDDMLYDASAKLKDGRTLGSSGWSRSGQRDGNVVESVSFPILLREVESFAIRSREIQTVVFDNVVLPPLPKGGDDKSSTPE